MRGRYRHIDQVGQLRIGYARRSSGPEDLDASGRLSRLRVSLATGSTWTSERHSPAAASSGSATGCTTSTTIWRHIIDGLLSDTLDQQYWHHSWAPAPARWTSGEPG